MDALKHLGVTPVVGDGADQVDVRVNDRAYTRYVKRPLGLEEVLRVVGDTVGVEDVCVRGSPGLSSRASAWASKLPAGSQRTRNGATHAQVHGQ